MGIKDITQKIDKEADDRIKSILDQAEKEAASILEEADSAADKRKREILEAGERSAQQEMQRILADAKLRAKKLEWASREEVIKESVQNAMAEIRKVKADNSYNGKEYKAILIALVQEAVASAGGKDLLVRVGADDSSYISQGDLDDLGKDLSVTLTLSEERVGGLGGVIVRTSDGSVEVNNTFDKRFERLEKDLRTDIAKVLFRGE